MKTKIIALSAIGIATVGIVIALGAKRPAAVPKIYDSHEANLVHANRRSIDDHYARADWKAAKPLYADFVASNKDNPNKEVQDEVASARIRIGYIEAKEKNFVEARKVLLEADQEYRGTEAESADYGSLDDQAAYQAIVCLENTGDKADAEKEYEKFLTERKLSPLVHACWRRLKRLNGGKAKPEHDALLQVAVTANEQHGRLESAMCGPKAIVEILDRFKNQQVDYHEIAQRCKVDKNGSTLENLISALTEYGFKCEAFELNANDFRKIEAPAIWLKSDHYVAIIERNGNHIRVYDSLANSRQLEPLPHIDDAKFRAKVVKLQL